MHIRAAKYLNVPPWELGKQSHVWTLMALTAENAEGEAQKIVEQFNKSKGKL